MNMDFKKFDNQETLIEPIKDSFAVKRLKWFTNDFYAVTDEVFSLNINK